MLKLMIRAQKCFCNLKVDPSIILIFGSDCHRCAMLWKDAGYSLRLSFYVLHTTTCVQPSTILWNWKSVPLSPFHCNKIARSLWRDQRGRVMRGSQEEALTKGFFISFFLPCHWVWQFKTGTTSAFRCDRTRHHTNYCLSFEYFCFAYYPVSENTSLVGCV